MAKNIIFEDAEQLSVACTFPASPKSGDIVIFGDRAGVAQTDERADGRTTVDFEAVATVSVKGVDGSGNSAVADGDVLYYVDADTPHISKKATGIRVGVAMSVEGQAAGGTLVAGGATGTIRVYVGL